MQAKEQISLVIENEPESTKRKSKKTYDRSPYHFNAMAEIKKITKKVFRLKDCWRMRQLLLR